MGRKTKDKLYAFATDERGATAIEYGLIAAGIAGVIVAAVSSVGDNMRTVYYDKIASAFQTLPK